MNKKCSKTKCILLKNILKCIFFIYFFLFLTSTYQNNLKTHKNINLKQKKLNKNLIFLKNTFKT
jgi:hypothetical protein